MIASVSYPRSASKYSALKSEISDSATAQSATVASVIKNRTGIPRASTAKCIFVLSPASDLARQYAARGRAEHFAHKARYTAEEFFHAFFILCKVFNYAHF